MKKQHIFFDLDNTLWDFEKNSRETLSELYHKHRLEHLGVRDFEFFMEKYRERNAMMWEQYRLGKIDKKTLRDQRFPLTFWDMGLDAELAPAALTHEYLEISPKKTHLFPNTHDTLEYLADKYLLHILTNGFAEVQEIKLQESDLKKYFQTVIISENIGYKKPDINIFLYSMKHTGSNASDCTIIGDGLDVDIAGGRNAGWRTVYFNPEKNNHDEQTDFEISCLSELKTLL
ncbi:MAG: noncanonical pyrimidine nucleotidase, YjjG family [Bacteroidetes bacterium]|nr:MAG: noncanonical pyrimidine nucleotidase, YjjG family [Bacteroidota bacterium]REK05055.1 MAG: noncanonical pyrimidine nucleotidase, YjjG family [Bacteroidota bacterium]REK35555.1 MAG: noncanonical pyrimidine nucleotidase, YjjG family [Bacteroidota bacterium]REK51658.1 MAG: noncanonical pyrimidine nucleotidase, YjjG family [Bacteroidota bacterium]